MRPRPERVRPRLRPNDLASRPHGPRGFNIPGQKYLQFKCLQFKQTFYLLFIDMHLVFYSLKTVVKRNCVQSSYTYAYNKNAMVTKVSTHKFDLKIASV